MTTSPCNRNDRWSPEPGVSQGNRRTNDIPGEPTSIAAVIARLLARMGLETEAWLSQLAEEWPVLVGTVVARHTRPGRLIGGVLVVYVDSSVWLEELRRFVHVQMLTKLQEKFGAERIRSLRFQPDPDRRN